MNCSDPILFSTVYPHRCPSRSAMVKYLSNFLENGEDERCNDDIKSGIHESQCSNTYFDNYGYTGISLISVGENECAPLHTLCTFYTENVLEKVNGSMVLADNPYSNYSNQNVVSFCQDYNFWKSRERVNL